MTQPGPILELDVTGVAHGGVFVARHEGRVVFVPDAIPGERVRAQVTDQRASFWRAELLEVLDASPHRRAHVWSAASIERAPAARAGGADFGHIALEQQRELKRQVISDALERVGRLDPAELALTVEPALASADAQEREDGTRWRTRVSLHVDDDGRVGPFAARSHRVIEVDDLPLATASIAAAVPGRTAGLRAGRVDLVEPADGRVRVIPRPQARDGRRRGAARPAAPVEVVEERVGDRIFRLDVGGFWQVHRLAAHSITRAVRDALDAVGGVDPAAHHLDLYGGVGLLAAAVADAGGTRITSVESDARATEHAGGNLAEWVGARAETGRVESWLEAFTTSLSAPARDRLAAGVVVLDPPRAGAGRSVVERVVDLHPAHVVYVACDPVALARDMAVFAGHGYRAEAVRGLDLFPHSHHVEAVTVLSRTAR